MILSVALCAALVAAAEPDRPATGESGVTTGLLDAMVARLLAEAKAKALEHVGRREWLPALAALEEAHDLDAADADVTYELGRVLFELGQADRAWHFLRLTYKLAPARPGLAESLARVALARAATPAELGEVAAWLDDARLRDGPVAELSLWQARVAARRQLWSDADRYFREVAVSRPADDALRLEIGDTLRDSGHEEEALAWYRQVEPTGAAGEAARERIWQLEVDGQARRFGWTQPAAGIPAPARERAERARALVGEHRLADAEKALREALAAAPHFSEARVALADLLRAQRRTSEAELEYLRVLALDQSSAPAYANLAALYLDGDEAEHAAEAVILLGRALQLRPDWSQLYLSLALALRRIGDLPRAQAALTTYLSTSPPAPGRREAEELLLAMAPLLAGDTSGADPPAAAPAGSRRELIESLNRARAFLARGESDAAMAELSRVVAAERGPDVRNLEGAILHATGKLGEAADAFRESLAARPDQAEVHEQLGVVLTTMGSFAEAREHLKRAEELGDADATFLLGRLLVRDLEGEALGGLARLRALWRARQRLSLYLAARPEGAHAAEAKSLRAEVDARLLSLFLLLALAALLPLGGGGLLWRRRFGGATLAGLVRRHPEASAELQQILAAIRHEVLKHHTMALEGLAQTVTGSDAAARLEALRGGLLPDRGRWAVAERFETYVADLDRLGARFGLRLNLRWRDRTLAPVFAGLERLRLAAALAQPRRRGRVRARVPALLRQASELLNVRAFAELERMVQQLRTAAFDAPALQRLFDRIRAEPAFAGVEFAPLELDGGGVLPARVVCPWAALTDVLGNLLRNAIQASIRTGQAPVRVGMRVATELDHITGLETIEIRVRDRSPELLDAEAMRQRDIAGGLGLVQQLLARHEGSLDVAVEAPPWSKAVVVRLPRDAGEAR